jgi:hypothetical protein
MTDRDPPFPKFAVIDRTGGQPRVLLESEADELAKIWKPLTAKDVAELNAFCEAIDARRAGQSIEEVVAAHSELDRDELLFYLEGVIMPPLDE